ncbi:MAG: right-handed parallel beta-helix repeat-containing protein [Thermoleophilia bacterium]
MSRRARCPRSTRWWLPAALLLGPALPAVAAAAPVVRFADATGGPVRGGPGGRGLPIAIYGTGFGAQRGSSTVTIGGRPVAAYLEWGGVATNPDLRRILVQPGPGAVAGPIVVHVGGAASAPTATFTPTRGRILWVAPAGSDSAPCSQRRPCATIQHVIDRGLRPGDAVLVRGGQLTDDEVWLRATQGGTATRPIVIRNAPGERPVFARTTRPVIVEGSHVVFAGFRFGPGKALVVGADPTGSDDIRAVDNSFSGNLGYAAVGTHGDNLLIAGNVCDATGSSQGTEGHCFYISNGAHIRLLWNVGRGVPGYGIHIYDQRRSTPDIRRRITDVLVQGNTLTGSTQRSGMIVAMDDEGHMGNLISGVRVQGNTFMANNHVGLVIGGNVTGVRVTQNRFVQNGRQGVNVYDQPTIHGVRITGNLFDQRDNANCHVFCDWFPRADVQVGAHAVGVVLRGNRYVRPRRVIGAPPG